ncbi:RNA polymerase II subunit A C-terminal domain phosphatase [Armadillidium nasatum]|uniref:RNA polymerase II subunit A C-terminal domain phosphatase n=1 Tax=Armadillidium nasatum TaxID=96803 RepID=A0A5N5SX19_9CRUS|nr:RNA polymerase II subunit A C-terminal domain phosphatase [Armadillidium nasatum]
MSYLKQYLTLPDETDSSLGFKVKSINTKLGAHLYKGKRICELINNSNKTSINIKAEFGGIVSELFLKIDSTINIGDSLIEVKPCLHPTILGNICCDCGVVLEKNSNISQENKNEGLVSMLHSIPDLKVSKEEATRVGNEDIKHLLDKRKLVLLVDLDQTLIHTTNDNIPPKLKDVFHFQLIPNGHWYHTRIRPYTNSFLNNISKLYELHICTFGVREYAHCIASFLDTDRKLFGDRILSRNECLDPMSKKANLSSLFPCGDNLVCIIDDRSDVWNFAPNVVQVMPYHFFQHTGDINAPPGLQKKENDNSKDFSPNKDKEKYSEEEEDKEQKDTVSDENEGKTSEKVESDLHLEEKEKSSSEKCNAEDMGTNIKSDLHLEEEEKSRSEKCNAEDMGTNIKSDLHLEEEEKSKSEKCNAENMGTDIKELQEASEFEKGTETDDPDDITAIKTDVVPKETKENNDPCDKETIQNDSCHKETNKYDDPEDSAAVKNTDSDTLDVDDDDDYLLYLEDILKRLHAIFYKDYDQKLKMNKEELPDLKEIVPDSRKKVLSGCHLVLSCVVPQNTALIDSKVYHIATSLGATVSSKIIAKAKGKDHPDLNYTTHVVAANQHTEKVHQAKRLKNIKIVTPNWLWCCAERWEHVDERLFELTDEVEKTVIRNPPMHCFVNANKPRENVLKDKPVYHKPANLDK